MRDCSASGDSTSILLRVRVEGERWSTIMLRQAALELKGR